jgi:hypothetical protein
MENGALLTELSVNKDAFDQAKLNIIQGIENIYNAIENLAPGTTLEDQIFGGSEGKT